jgi:hypothetical protein
MVLDLAPPRLPHPLYRLDVLRAVLYRTAPDLRGACSLPSRRCSKGTHVLPCGVPVHSGTAPFSAGPYTCSMQLESEVLR